MTSRSLETVPIAQLKPWTKNARTHSRKQVKQIADSIERFGFTAPVLIDKQNTILAGHGRVAAAKLLEMVEVPCVRLEGMTTAEKRAYVLADNKLARNAGWARTSSARSSRASSKQTSTSTSLASQLPRSTP